MSCDTHCMHKCAYGLGVGVMLGLLFLTLSLLAGYADIGEHFVDALGEVLVGYSEDVLGALIGFVWGLGIGTVMGYVIALVHNVSLCVGCMCCKKHRGGKH